MIITCIWASGVWATCTGYNLICMQVAERALYFWNNENVLALFEENSTVVMPILFDSLYGISKQHWNK